MGVQVVVETKGGCGHGTAVTHQDYMWVLDMLVLIPAQTRQASFMCVKVSVECREQLWSYECLFLQRICYPGACECSCLQETDGGSGTVGACICRGQLGHFARDWRCLQRTNGDMRVCSCSCMGQTVL